MVFAERGESGSISKSELQVFRRMIGIRADQAVNAGLSSQLQRSDTKPQHHTGIKGS